MGDRTASPPAASQTLSGLRTGGPAKAAAVGYRRRTSRFEVSAWQSLGSAERRSRRAAQYPHQRPVAHLLYLAQWRCLRCRNCRLSLGGTMAKTEKLPPIHPGEILREDFMAPLGLSMNRLALDLHVPVTRIAEIVHQRRGITPDTALRLGRYFNTTARFWLSAQSSYDLEVAQDALQRTIERDVRPLVA